jgi:hypothetical protein
MPLDPSFWIEDTVPWYDNWRKKLLLMTRTELLALAETLGTVQWHDRGEGKTMSKAYIIEHMVSYFESIDAPA